MLTKRNTTIKKLIAEGQHTPKQIGLMFGISAERVRQINKKPVSRAEVRELWKVDEVLRSITQDQIIKERSQQWKWTVI